MTSGCVRRNSYNNDKVWLAQSLEGLKIKAYDTDIPTATVWLECD